MRVRVQLFAAARQAAGEEAIELVLGDGATVRELRRALAEGRPELARWLPHVLFAIDAEYARDDAMIRPGTEVACIPPVSGG